MPTNAIGGDRRIADRRGPQSFRAPPTHTAPPGRSSPRCCACSCWASRRRRPTTSPTDRQQPEAATERHRQPSAARRTELPSRVETRHSVQTEAGPLDYRAIAETIELTTPKGEPSASIFTVSYIAEPAAPSAPSPPDQPARPACRCPRSGRWRSSSTAVPAPPPCFCISARSGRAFSKRRRPARCRTRPFTLADNPHTWLAFTDLVFVDPVGTGYSRGKGKGRQGGQPGQAVLGGAQRLRSLAAVVRRWLTRHDRWTSPVFLVGESYGGLRAAALGRVLARDVGVAVSGFVLVSPALDIDMLHPDISNVLAPALQLPSYAATAAAFAEASPIERARAAERFAMTDYLSGLAALTGIPEPGNPLIERTAALIGLPAEIVRRERGRVDPHTFARELRRPERRDPERL